MAVTRPIEILLVEDNPGDVHLTLEALNDARIHNSVRVVEDGESALGYLLGDGENGKAPTPDLVVLDLNLPRKDGHEVLAELRRHPRTRAIPVVILTSSERPADIDASYGLQANCYVTKPVQAEEFARVVREISDFWFEIVKLPTVPRV